MKVVDELRDLIRREQNRQGSASALEQSIAEANGRGSRRIHRKKLAEITAGKDVALRLGEIQALQNYLTALDGFGLERIFMPKTILEHLEYGEDILFLFGAEANRNLSWWDVRGMVEATRSLHMSRTAPRWSIDDVLSAENTSNLGPESYDEMFRGRTWYKHFADQRGPSIVTFASPIANNASELVLSEMFGVAPFERAAESKVDLPFRFILTGKTCAKFPSSFTEDGDTLRGLPKVSRETERSTLGMLIEGTIHHLDRSQGIWETYGVLAASRTQSGRLFAVAAGITAPATYAAAKLIPQISMSLRSGPNERRVAWAPVRATVRADEGSQGDQRALVDFKGMRDEHGEVVRYWRKPEGLTNSDPVPM